MLNKILITLCALSLSFAVACGGGDVKVDASTTENVIEVAAPEEATEETPEEAVAADEAADEDGELAEESEPEEEM